MTGHLQEGISSVNIVYQVPTAVKAKQFVDLSTSKKNNDTPLEWKETVVGGGDFANFAGVGGGDDWDKPDAAAKDVDAGWGDGAADNWGGGSAAGESFKDSIGTVATVQDDNVGGNDNWADAVHEEEQNGGGFNGHQEEVESFNW